MRRRVLLPAALLVAGLAWDAQTHASAGAHAISMAAPAHILVVIAAGALVASVFQRRAPVVLSSGAGAGVMVAVLAAGWLTAVDLDPISGPSPAPAQRAAAQDLRVRTVRAIQRYRDIRLAYADGYVPANQSDAPLQHLINPAYLAAGRTLDPERPESLVYSGISFRPVLLGAMYIMPPGQPGPEVGGALTTWHDHADLCFTPGGGISGHVGPRGCAPGSALVASPQMLHVWLVDNPAGPFATDVPRLVLLQHLAG